MPLLGKFGTATSRTWGFNGGGIVNVPIPVPPGTVYNYDVYANRGPTYVPGLANIVVTVPASTTIGSTSAGAYAISVPSAFSPTDTVTIVNNGLIQGMGGGGGNGGANGPPSIRINSVAGGTGGNAIYVNRPTTITNNGVIAAGGGGGGGGGGNAYQPNPFAAGVNVAGGGGGGGAGTDGGAGGTARLPSAAPGSPGTSPAGGAGGLASGAPIPATGRGGPGGAGGGRGASGTGGSNSPNATVPYQFGAAGGSAGNYITGNPFVTWPVTGTRQGGVA